MIFRPSGGLLYHWRARREGHRWQSFARVLAEWLESWSCPKEQLILIGPSAGYTLPTAWLKQFKSIHAYDLDPLAPFFFRRRHRGVGVHFTRRDLFWQNGRLSVQNVNTILEQHPQASILFTNVLGQLLLEGRAEESAWRQFLLQLRRTLAQRHWASYHDTFTHENGEIIDHLMDGPWKSGLESREFVWDLSARSRHQIEGVRA